MPRRWPAISLRCPRTSVNEKPAERAGHGETRFAAISVASRLLSLEHAVGRALSNRRHADELRCRRHGTADGRVGTAPRSLAVPRAPGLLPRARAPDARGA